MREAQNAVGGTGTLTATETQILLDKAPHTEGIDSLKVHTPQSGTLYCQLIMDMQ